MLSFIRRTYEPYPLSRLAGCQGRRPHAQMHRARVTALATCKTGSWLSTIANIPVTLSSTLHVSPCFQFNARLVPTRSCRPASAVGGLIELPVCGTVEVDTCEAAHVCASYVPQTDSHAGHLSWWARCVGLCVCSRGIFSFMDREWETHWRIARGRRER